GPPGERDARPDAALLVAVIMVVGLPVVMAVVVLGAERQGAAEHRADEQHGSHRDGEPAAGRVDVQAEAAGREQGEGDDGEDRGEAGTEPPHGERSATDATQGGSPRFRWRTPTGRRSPPCRPAHGW